MLGETAQPVTVGQGCKYLPTSVGWEYCTVAVPPCSGDLSMGRGCSLHADISRGGWWGENLAPVSPARVTWIISPVI